MVAQIAISLCVLATVTIMSLELLRRILDFLIFRYMAFEIIANIENLKFMTWHDLETFYEDFGRKNRGISAMRLEPLEGRKIVAIAENILKYKYENYGDIKNAIIENA